jgi:hypothetical protein
VKGLKGSSELGEKPMKGLLSIASMLLVVTSSAYANEQFNVCNYGKETIASVTCYGPAVLLDTSVTGNMNVSGAVRATNFKVNDMKVAGSAILTKGKVEGAVDVAGNFEAYGVEFMQSLHLTTNTALFDRSIVRGAITMHSDKDPVVVVQCGTTVVGSITFEGKPGIVRVTTDDSMIQSKIVNGDLELVDKDDCKK